MRELILAVEHLSSSKVYESVKDFSQIHLIFEFIKHETDLAAVVENISVVALAKSGN